MVSIWRGAIIMFFGCEVFLSLFLPRPQSSNHVNMISVTDLVEVFHN
uniref:Uncharacterized protein n=1 Tax=Lepeophtheirus salmonis TaxID=72036 RepID=A0A0K2UAX8_LEPSM